MKDSLDPVALVNCSILIASLSVRGLKSFIVELAHVNLLFRKE